MLISYITSSLTRLKYILSNRQKRKRKDKMYKRLTTFKYENELDRALDYCMYFIEYCDEPTVTVRSKTEIQTKVSTVTELHDELMSIYSKCMISTSSNKYIDLLPNWYYVDTYRVLVDDFFIDTEYRYTSVKFNLTGLYDVLVRIKNELSKEHNEKFDKYYVAKFKRSYLEVTEIIKQLL